MISWRISKGELIRVFRVVECSRSKCKSYKENGSLTEIGYEWKLTRRGV